MLSLNVFTTTSNVHLSNAVLQMLEDTADYGTTAHFNCPNCDGSITVDEHLEMGICSTCYGE